MFRLAPLLLFGIVAAAADPPPQFTSAGIARGIRPARMVVPGTFLTIYGTHLGPTPGKCAAAMPATYPREFCDTRVLIGDTPAELLHVSDQQINFKVPMDSPQGGTVDLRVVYNGQSSPPVSMKAGFEPTTVSLEGAAFTGMPVWLKIDLPYEFTGAVGYPGVFGPARIGCHQVELRRDGQRLPLQPGSNWMRYGLVLAGNICGYHPSQTDRLPLHLLYRLDIPGVYEVRYALRDMTGVRAGGTPHPEFRARSEWTRIEVLAARPGQRSAWLQSLRDRAPADPGKLLTDILPSLAGVPDDASFDILSAYLWHPDSEVQRYALDCLTYWPWDFTSQKLRDLLQTRGPSEVVTRYLTYPVPIAPR